MEAPNRHEQRRQKTRRKLLDAAREVFSAKGYADATVLDITELANVSKRTLYVHFPEGKDEILSELALRSVDEVVAEIDALAEQRENMTLREGMELAMSTVFRWMERHPALAQIVYGPDAEPTLNAMIVDYSARRFMDDMSKACTFRVDADVPLEIVAHMKSAALGQLIRWSLTHEHGYTPDDFARFIIEVFYGTVANLYPEDVREQIG